MGEGFTWETQDRERDIEAARAAWEEAKIQMMADPELHLVLLDELNIVLRKDYLAIDDVVAKACSPSGPTFMSWSPAAMPSRN